MEFTKQSERWEDEQLHTLELALGFPPGTITAADIEYLIRRSYTAYDDSEDDGLCFSMQQHCQIRGDQGANQAHESRKSSRKPHDTHRSASSSSQKRTSTRNTQNTEKSRGHHHRRK